MERDTQNPDYGALLADMIAKKVALENAITGLRAALAAGLLGASVEFQTNSTDGSPQPSPGGTLNLPRGAFLGKSAGEAIKLFLTTIRRKQTNKEIAQALRDGGLESAGNFDNFITSALFRLKKDGVLLRFDDGWGLSEWYNEAFRTKLGATKPSNGKKPAKKRVRTKHKAPAKSAPVLQPQTPAPVSAPKMPIQTVGIDSLVRSFLDSLFPAGEGAREIAAGMAKPLGVVNFSLVRLLKKGIVKRAEDGKYYAVKEHE